MRTKAFIFSLLLLATTIAQASCYKIYQQNLAEVNETIKNSNSGRAQLEGLAIGGAAFAITLASVSGGPGGPIVFTVAGAGMISSLYLASKYIDIRTENSAQAALARKALLESSLNLLKEAKAGNGPLLQNAMIGINREISTSISLKDLADKINEQSEKRLYCQTSDQIMSSAGILQSAIDELK